MQLTFTSIYPLKFLENDFTPFNPPMDSVWGSIIDMAGDNFLVVGDSGIVVNPSPEMVLVANFDI